MPENLSIQQLIDTIVNLAKVESLKIGRNKEHLPIFIPVVGQTQDVVHLRGDYPYYVLIEALSYFKPDGYVTVTEARIKNVEVPDGIVDSLNFEEGEIAGDPSNQSILVICAAVRNGTFNSWMARCLNEDFPRDFSEWGEVPNPEGRMVITQW